MTNDVNGTGTHARCNPDAPARRGPRVQPFKGCASLEWDKTIALLTKHQDKAFEPDAFIQMEGPSAMEAFQDVDSRSGDSQESGLSRVDAMGYRFVYKKKQASTASASDNVVTYSCFCAQNDKEITKTWLTDEENKRVLHHFAHCHYVDISLNDEITKMVEQMRDQPASNTHPLWSDLNKAACRLDDDQVKSTQMLLQKIHGKEIELILIRQEDGIHCIVFGFKKALDG
ncbi:hypothetical protein DFH09DRAFT_1097505 [Mycena vulgaris]|nr:hypothetical protein DFH09DRAFT_1097505 [Mycena vulgaris]